MIKENLEEVEARITRACERSGRERSEVTLISVSKTKPVEMLQEAYDAGSRDFGENKPQEIREKYPQLPTDMPLAYGLDTCSATKSNISSTRSA